MQRDRFHMHIDMSLPFHNSDKLKDFVVTYLFFRNYLLLSRFIIRFVIDVLSLVSIFKNTVCYCNETFSK